MMQWMSLTDFSILLGFYNAEFTWTLEESHENTRRRLSTAPAYDPHYTNATILCTLALWYIHFVLSNTLTGYGNSTRVISHGNFDFLLRMVDWFHLHFGYKVAISNSHQGTNPRISSLFIGSYVTRMIRYLGILEGTNRMRIVGSIASMTLEILSSTGMFQHVQTARRAEYGVKRHTDSSLIIASVCPLAGDTTPTSLPRPLSIHPDQVNCSFIAFRWVQRSVTCIAEHLGVLLSPEPVSPVRPTSHIGVDTSNLGSQASSSSSGDFESTPCLPLQCQSFYSF